MKLPTVIVAHPSTFTKSTKEQIIDLIVQGGQIKYNDAKVGIHRAFLLAICSVDENVIATACLKNPRISYYETLSKLAYVSLLPERYPYELGYIMP